MIENVKCPLCDGPMKSRANASTGQRFWGCAAFPKCKGTRNTDGEAPKPYRDHMNDLDDRAPSERQQDNDRSRWRNQ